MRLRTALASATRDPRHGQIAVLGSLLVYGLAALDFAVPAAQIAVTLGTALGLQAILSRRVGVRFDPRSPLISGLSLCLLLRTPSLAVAAGAAAVAIGSKFVLRARGKHVWNPTNLALVVALGAAHLAPAAAPAWVSPGQWGQAGFFAFLVASAGLAVVRRAERSDVTWTFLAAWAALLFGRAAWLGDPLAIPLHQMESGALLVFAFYMISDPKTTPDSRTGRIVFAVAVAAFAGWLRFARFEPDALLWALAAAAPTVVLLDRLVPAARYLWPGERLRAPHRPSHSPGARPRIAPSAPGALPPALAPVPTPVPRQTGRGVRKEISMSTQPRASSVVLAAALAAASLLAAPPPADAFCGFYVARADASLFNRASRVVLVRDEERTVITMASDYQGEPEEFALVVPVPTVLEREQIHVADPAIVDHLDAYTAPRLVEYHDPNPCARPYPATRDLAAAPFAQEESAKLARRRAEARGVTIEARYSVGEYDILILSATESRGLVAWLRESGYRLPAGAEPVVGSYLAQGMKFFVAKVDLEAQAELGYRMLRPLQVAFESPRFMLPIRLGTVNAPRADGARSPAPEPQELFVYALTRRGRVETTNYRTVRLPSDQEIPPYVEADFPRFYRDLFAHQLEREGGRVVFLEYAWDMGWCDPCAADPLTADELAELGVFWLPRPAGGATTVRAPQPPQAQDVFVTRLHLSYTGDTFPEDLHFQETADRTNFQGRYVMRQPWTGSPDACPAARRYFTALFERQEREARTLARLTGWELDDIRSEISWAETGAEPADEEPWWRRLWPGAGVVMRWLLPGE